MAEAQENLKPLSKSEKAAVLMLCMDEGTTSQLFEKMEDTEIKKVATALLTLQNIPATQIQQVFEEFSKGITTQKEKPAKYDININGRVAAQNLIEKSMDPDRGGRILETLSRPSLPGQGQQVNFSEIVQQFPDEKIYDLVKNEHPQIMSIILANSKKKVIRDTLEKLPEDIQVEIVSRMASLKLIPGKVIKDLQQYIMQKMSAAQSDVMKKGQSVDEYADVSVEGMNNTVKLLKGLKGEWTDKLVSSLEKLDAQVGMEISKKLFTVEDLERANDPGIREMLRGVTNDDLKVALKNAPDTIKNKVFGNMSERAAMILKEDMEVLPPLKVEDIELAQIKILKVAKDLIKDGKMILTELIDEE